MNNLMLNQQPSTISTLVVLSGMLTCLPLTNDVNRIEYSPNRHKETFNLNNSSPTFSQYRAFVSQLTESEPISLSQVFEQTVTNFYAKLVADQEPLGAEFESVLYENLWDLYKR